VDVGPVVADRFGARDEAVAVDLAAEQFQRVHRRWGSQDQDGAALMRFAQQLDDLLPGALEVDVVDVELVSEFGEVGEDAGDLRAVGAVVGESWSIGEIFFEQEEGVALHGGYPGVGIDVMTPVVLILREGVDLQVATIAFLVATIVFLVATIARWWIGRNRVRSRKSTAWPRWLPEVGLDDAEVTSTEAIHRVAAVATCQFGYVTLATDESLSQQPGLGEID